MIYGMEAGMKEAGMNKATVEYNDGSPTEESRGSS